MFLNEIPSPVVGPNVACRNTVHELPVRLTSLYIRIPKTPRTEPGKNDLHYCQRTTASGDCRLRPAGAERSRFGNGTSGWAVRLYDSKGARPIAFTTSSLGKWTLRDELTTYGFSSFHKRAEIGPFLKGSDEKPLMEMDRKRRCFGFNCPPPIKRKSVTIRPYRPVDDRVQALDNAWNNAHGLAGHRR